jgi:c-di-GMP-binding flagellar brake protein YcgR
MNPGEAKVRSGIVNFERRKHPRISVDLPIEYSLVEDSSLNRTARAANASEGGLLVYLPEPVQIGQTLKVKIYFSIPKMQEVNLRAEVAWVDTRLGEKPVEYRAGLKFHEISPEDLEKLSFFLKTICS